MNRTRPRPPAERSRPRRRARGARLALAVVVLASGTACALPTARSTNSVAPATYRFQRAVGPARTLVLDRGGAVVATLTDGARTVVLVGPSRRFGEPDTTRATVTTRAWVRLAPAPWRAGGERDAAFPAWLSRSLADRGPDVLAVAMQYQRGAADLRDASGRRLAGGASYGPGSGAERAENSDFNDFLGLDWTSPDGTVRHADPERLGALDCSGFVRMVYGYRSGYPLGWEKGTGARLPRRAVTMATAGPGVTVSHDRGGKVPDVDRLQPGDLVLFDADPGDGPAVDHVGIFLGPDSAGRPRFLSSRKTANGPTMGDLGGASLLDGTGLYARAFRRAKRL